MEALAGLDGAAADTHADPPFQRLIVSALSRIGRNSVRTPVAVLSRVRISLADEASEVSTMMQSLLGSFERKRAGQRTRDALRVRFAAGAATGGAAYGYRIERTGTGFAHYLNGAPGSDFRGLLRRHPTHARQVLRLVVGDEGRFVCTPFDDARGRGLDVRGEGDYGRLFTIRDFHTRLVRLRAIALTRSPA